MRDSIFSEPGRARELLLYVIDGGEAGENTDLPTGGTPGNRRNEHIHRHGPTTLLLGRSLQAGQEEKKRRRKEKNRRASPPKKKRRPDGQPEVPSKPAQRWRPGLKKWSTCPRD